jgi:hypothetical protein
MDEGGKILSAWKKYIECILINKNDNDNAAES